MRANAGVRAHRARVWVPNGRASGAGANTHQHQAVVAALRTSVRARREPRTTRGVECACVAARARGCRVPGRRACGVAVGGCGGWGSLVDEGERHEAQLAATLKVLLAAHALGLPQRVDVMHPAVVLSFVGVVGLRRSSTPNKHV